ncbi:MAG: competence/damage-inducible protein A [Deltaproteobacteria bacterium]|nr:competence/damage-inducible protein A [Deltaproteobacteria bacterium]
MVTKAEILAVGTELLMGQIANTNAQYISARLPDVGIGVYYHSVVGDNRERLRDVLRLAISRSDLLITTGGLGPTKDDLTKETIAELFDRRLITHQESLDRLKAFFNSLKRPMTENNLKQANMPDGAIVLRNNNGTAPGCIMEEKGKIVIMLPGPPSEMKVMFEEGVIPFLSERSDSRIVSRFLRIFGIGESSMEDAIKDLIENQSNPTIAPYAKEGELALRITARYPKDGGSKDLIAPIEEEIKKRLGVKVYSSNNKGLDEVVSEMLLETNTSIAIAESCTGGLISARLTETPGISRVFNRGIISYSNQAKIEDLHVKKRTLERFGAVSRETAIEMAKGVRNISETDLGLSVTGIAGPDGGSPEKPVGLVYIALDCRESTECKELNLWGSRNRIRNVTALYAFDMIRRRLLERKD